MSFKLLSLVYKVGSVFAVTPISIEYEDSMSWSEKLYKIFVFGLVTVAAVITLTSRTIFADYHYARIIVCLVTEINMYGMCLYTIIILNFFKRKSLRNLIRNLKMMSKYKKVDEKLKVPFYFGFVSINVIHLSLHCYIFVIHYKIEKMSYIKKFILSHYQVYVDFLIKCMLCVITKIILLHYIQLRHFLKQQLSNVPKDKIPLKAIKTVQYKMFFLQNNLQIYNELFGWPLLFILLTAVVELLNIVHSGMFLPKGLQIFQLKIIYTFYIVWFLVCCIL